jgi:hypothetical protein
MDKILKSTPAQLRAAKNYKRRHHAQHLESCQAWRVANPDKVREYNRNRDRKMGEGAQEHFDAEIKHQKNLCAVCDEPLVKSPRADHNHETGKWRGVVCPRCNIALGYYENLGLMQKALAYLKRWSS